MSNKLLSLTKVELLLKCNALKLIKYKSKNKNENKYNVLCFMFYVLV